MLAGAPPVEQVLKEFAVFSDGAILVGHNLPFDCKFLEYYGAKYGIAFSQDRVDMLPRTVLPYYREAAQDSA